MARTSARMGSPDLLERSVEVDGVRALIRAAVAGAGQAMVLQGPAGIGKTALLDEALRAAQNCDIQTARATGSELERDYAFGAVRELLGALIMDLSGSDRAELFDGAAAPAAAVLGVAVANRGQSSMPEDPAAVMHALYWLVANLADYRPVLLIADDIQWFDPPSQRFLAYLARRVGDLAVGLLMATRPVDASAVVVAALLADRAVEVLSPAPLSPIAIRQVVARHWHDVVDDRFVTACYQAGGGNPFLTEQLLRALVEADVEPTGAAAAAVVSIGAEGSRRQVLSRLARLPAASVEVTRAIAVLGPDATIGHIAVMAEGQSEAQVAATVEALASTELVVAERPVRFVHPLVRSAVYQDMGLGLRAWWHGRAARTLAERAVPADRLASHLLLIEPDGDPWVVDVLLAAADAAKRRGAPDAAAVLYRRALAEPPLPQQRASVLLRLGTAEQAAGQGDAIEHLRMALEAADSDDQRVAAAYGLSLSLGARGRGIEAVAMLEQLHDRTEDPPARLLIQAAIVQEAVASPVASPNARRHLDALARLAVAGDLEAVPPMVAVMAAEAAWCANAPAAAISRLLGSVFGRYQKVSSSAIPAPGAGLAFFAVMVEHADVLQILEWVVATANGAGDLFRAGAGLAVRALHRQRSGALVSAASDADAALEAFQLAEHRQFLPLALAVRVYCHIERRELEPARHLIDTLAYGSSLEDVTLFHSFVAHARGLVNMAEGRIPEAVADFRDVGRRLGFCPIITPSFLAWRSDLAVALVADGDRGEAIALAAEELALARAFGTARCIGIATRAVGLAHNDHQAGERAVRDAVAALGGSQAPVELARALLDLGVLLRRRGAKAEAREPLSKSLDLATACGALTVAERARLELVAIGARPRRSRIVGIDSLTVTEARTAELAVNGATNKQIAQAMFVTVKTVETHLAHAYQKLGITRRAELAGALCPK